MKIENTEISSESVYFIAEAGVNHNGNIKTAKRLIDAAVESGADAIKFQTFRAEYSVSENQSKTDYQKEATKSEENQYEMLKRLELTKEEHKLLIKYCESKEITFLSTPAAHPFNVDLLMDLDVAAIKIGSSDITNRILLERCATCGVPLIISTGMSTLEEINDAYHAIQSINEKVEVAFLHCVSEYPTELFDTNLRSLRLMKEELETPIGFSDHTLSLRVPGFAVSAGATIIEKHLTLDRELSGPDHQASLEPSELDEAVSIAREAVKTRGGYQKAPTSNEENMKSEIRRSLHLSRDVKTGEELTKNMLLVKRPNDGASAMRYKEFLGKEFRHNKSEGDPVTSTDFKS